MSETEKGTYQMLWDCAYCGSEKLLGLDHRHCPGCGSPQDPERRYFPSDEDKVAVVDHRYTGADRICPACETPNAAIAEFCVNCGSPLTEAAQAKKRQDLAAGVADSAKKAEQELGGSGGGGSSSSPYREKTPPPEVKRSPLVKVGLGCFFALVFTLIVGALVAAFWKKDASMAVTGHAWERTIEVEAYKTVRESAWDDQVPRGASNVRCSREVRDYEKVADGETCTTKRVDQGDGTYKEVESCKTKYRKEPVYDDKCSYNIDKWVVDRTEKASGGSVKDTPKWPRVRTRGQEREGDRAEKYTVFYKASKGGSKYSCNRSQKDWQASKVGSKWSGKVGVMTDKLDCSTLKKR